ncbi:MAG: hypothetical protein KBC96_03355 [Armatimonadetes bacterium]|nr:hypothetical protein [Armatimonadota bacterium]
MSERSARVRTIVITAVLTALIAGGVVYSWQHSKVARLRNELHIAAQRLTAGDNRRSNDSLSLEARIALLEKKLAGLRRYPPVGNVPPEFLAVCGATLDEPDTPVVEYYVASPRHFTVIEKLRLLADRLSRLEFSDLPINVVRIETVKGKKVAVIDLRESQRGSDYRSWYGGYFQGSTGGGITQTKLMDTFLQRGYRGEWVDGVRFLYQGKPIQEGEWDHINLSGTIYR